jgi:hypothetical protein
MPIDYEIRPDAIWLRTVGDIEYTSGLGVLEAAVAEARSRAGGRRWPVVFDITRSEERRSADELRAIAQFLASQADVLEPRCAVVAVDDLHFGLARMFEAFADQHAVKVTVLRSLDEIDGWLVAVPDAAAPGDEPEREAGP